MRSSPEDLSDHGRLRDILLGLFAGHALLPVPDVTPEGWMQIARMAAQHRLQPWLHHKHRDNPAIPADIRAKWKAAFRSSAIFALQVARELAAANALLKNAGFAPLALKGAWLAWHAYPHPALRPMRDIDLLLTPDTVVAAFELLRANGYVQWGDTQIPIDNAVLIDKHLAPLVSPGGVMIELHHRMWEIDGRMDHAAPAADERAIRGRAIQSGEIAYVDPQDLLAHLIIHAIYDHRLDCGPLVLTDIALLLRNQSIDWPRFWHDARAQRWVRGAGLMLALVQKYVPDANVPVIPSDACVPPGVVEISASLLLQELETRQSAGFAATITAGGWKALALRMLARRKSSGESTIARNLTGQGGFANWAGSRILRTTSELARANVRHQSLELSRLSRWLDT